MAASGAARCGWRKTRAIALTINLLIQWMHGNQNRLPERRRNATELLMLKRQQIERIEAIVAGCFSRDDKGTS